MKKSSPLGTLLMVLIMVIPVLYTASIYSSLPYTIPTHFDINGRANAFGSKDMIWFTTVLLAAVSAGLYFLITNLPKIDPKKTAGQSPELFHKLAIIIVVFMCSINLIIIYATQHGSFNIGNFIFPLVGLLFLVLGNYMHSIKPNYFVENQTPGANRHDTLQPAMSTLVIIAHVKDGAEDRSRLCHGG